MFADCALFVVATAALLFVVQSPRIQKMSSARPSLPSGGDIAVVSEIGQGSRFEVWLPLVAQEVDAASASATFRRADVLHALGAV